MQGKVFIYLIVSVLVMWSLESININAIFKKNRVFQANLFYFFIGISLIYLVTNFIMDLYTSIKMF